MQRCSKAPPGQGEHPAPRLLGIPAAAAPGQARCLRAESTRLSREHSLPTLALGQRWELRGLCLPGRAAENPSAAGEVDSHGMGMRYSLCCRQASGTTPVKNTLSVLSLLEISLTSPRTAQTWLLQSFAVIPVGNEL